MKTEPWEMSETPEFVEDVAHYGIRPEWVVWWRRTIMKHPLIGVPVENLGNLPLFDHEVEGYVIRYIVIPQRRWVELMTLRPSGDDRRGTGQKLRDIGGRARKVLIDIARLMRLSG